MERSLLRPSAQRVYPFLLLFLLSNCQRRTEEAGSAAHWREFQACAVALAPSEGNDSIDRQIAGLQQAALVNADPSGALEQLGQRYVLKARVNNDPGYYKLAEQCALCLERASHGNPAALLLRGHVLHQLHRFKEAELVARELVAKRASDLDYGLLGDALLEQGKLQESTDAYQKMMDMRPSYQSYTRAAHVRWLVGDLRGATRLMEMAVAAANPRDPESVAWAHSRLALYHLQAGAIRSALRFSDAAVTYLNDYAPALLIRGRALLAQGRATAATEVLRKAASANPLPEYQWFLADALRATGRDEEARQVEDRLARQGAANDARTFALYLATRGEAVETAVNLARRELEVRSDVFTWDALAWSLAAAGQTGEAQATMRRALAHGTQDARLFFHAGMIAAQAGQKEEARSWLGKAKAMQHMLLPLERKQLLRELLASSRKS